MVSIVNIGILLTYALIAIGALIAISFGVLKLFSRTGNSKKTLIGISAFIAVVILSFVLASDSALPSYEKYEISSSSSKRVGMGLYTFYILTTIAIIGVIYSEFTKAFKK